MSEELYFNNELRKCLNAAGLSDCGENDAWNYWYQRVHKAHDQAVDRVTEAQRVENARLRELVSNCHGWLAVNCEKGYVIPRNGLDAIEQSMRELGVDV